QVLTARHEPSSGPAANWSAVTYFAFSRRAPSAGPGICFRSSAASKPSCGVSTLRLSPFTSVGCGKACSVSRVGGSSGSGRAAYGIRWSFRSGPPCRRHRRRSRSGKRSGNSAQTRWWRAAHATDARPLLVHGDFLEVAGFDDAHSRRVHILAERGVDLLQRERLNPGFKLLVIEHGAAQLFVRRDQADQRGLLGTAHLAGVGIGAFGLGDFGLREAFAQRLLQLIDEAGFHFGHIHRVAAYGGGEERRIPLAGRGEARGRAVAQSLPIANAVRH